MSDTMERPRPVMSLDAEIAAYEAMSDDLQKHHNGKFVVIRGGSLFGSFDTFDTAATLAVQAFGRGPYLIRQVGAPPAQLPASVLYIPDLRVA